MLWSSSTDFVRQPLENKLGYYWQVPKSFSAHFANVLCPIELTARITHTNGCLFEFRILSDLPCFERFKTCFLYGKPYQIFCIGERSIEREYEMFAKLDNRFQALPDNSLWVPVDHFVWNVLSWDSSIALSCFVKLPGSNSKDLWPSNPPKLRRTPGAERKRHQSRFGGRKAVASGAK